MTLGISLDEDKYQRVFGRWDIVWNIYTVKTYTGSS